MKKKKNFKKDFIQQTKKNLSRKREYMFHSQNHSSQSGKVFIYPWELDTIKTETERKEILDMKILNKQQKLKRSRLKISSKVYEDICSKRGRSYGLHLLELDRAANIPGYALENIDKEIIIDVYIRITKIIE